MPRRNLENSSKAPPFYSATEFEENGSSGCCDVHPGRLDISFKCSFLEDGEIHSRNAFLGCYRLLQQYPRFKKKIHCTLYWRWPANGTIKTLTMADFVESKQGNSFCEHIIFAYPTNFTADVEKNLLWLFGVTSYHRFRWFATFENKTPGERFPKFRSIIHVIDRSDRNPPIAAR